MFPLKEVHGNPFTLSIFNFFFICVAATVDFMVSRISPFSPLLLLVDHFGPIRDTIRSTVAATEIGKNKNS